MAKPVKIQLAGLKQETGYEDAEFKVSIQITESGERIFQYFINGHEVTKKQYDFLYKPKEAKHD